jgi:recombination protein RecA
MAKNQNNNVAPATQKTEPGAKKDALATALAQIEKQFGKGAIMKLGDNTAMQVDAISTGSLGLDLALGVGGVPRGRIIEVFGPESSGKTTLALHILAEAQKKGGEVAFIDVEHALDPAYASALGVNIDELLVSQPDTGEQAMEICEALVRSGAIDAIVVDSVAAMVPRAEIEGEMGDSHVGLQARLMSQAMRKLTSVIGKTNTVCVFINQLREKVGIVYGNPEVTTGGRALKYYSSVRIDIRRVEGLKDSSGQFIGNHTRAKIVKNKVAPPFREAEFDIMFGEGISKMSELIDVGVKLGIVQKSGAWFNYGDIRLGQGRDNAKQFLKDNPEIANDIEGQIRANADKLYATRRPAGKAAAAAAEKEEGGETASASKEPVVKAPARSRAMELLAGQELSSGQLYERLGRKFTQPTAAAVVAEMVERQYVDDERYARTRAHGLLAARKSRRAAAQDLRQKGLDAQQISAALEEAYASDEAGGDPELEAAAALVEGRYRGKLAAGRKDLVVAALARRGFAYPVIKEAIRRVEEDG